MNKTQRAKAIFNCLWFGILPWQVYEKTCHYSNDKDDCKDTYFSHLKLNMIIIKCLIMKTEHPSTHKFHTAKYKYFRWQRTKD